MRKDLVMPSVVYATLTAVSVLLICIYVLQSGIDASMPSILDFIPSEILLLLVYPMGAWLIAFAIAISSFYFEP